MVMRRDFYFLSCLLLGIRVEMYDPHLLIYLMIFTLLLESAMVMVLCIYRRLSVMHPYKNF